MLLEVLAYYHDHHVPHLRSDTAQYHALRIAKWVEGKRATDTRAVVAAIKRDLRPHYAPGTINRSLGALSKALADAWERGETDTDYSGLVKRVPDEHTARKVTLSLEDVRRLADCASENVRVAIWAALLTGCRRGEILKARPEDIGTDTMRVLAGNTKTLRYREVPIIAAARPWLARLPIPINFEGVKSGFARARVKAGMPHVQYRDLRRSCGTILLQSGAPMHVVSQILGHTSVTVTERHYAFLADSQKRDAMQRAFG
jgi:integrase